MIIHNGEEQNECSNLRNISRARYLCIVIRVAVRAIRGNTTRVATQKIHVRSHESARYIRAGILEHIAVFSFSLTWDSMRADFQTRLSSLSHLPFRLQVLINPCTVETVFVFNCWTVFLSLVHVTTRALSCCFPFGRRTRSARAAEGPSPTHIPSAIDETFHTFGIFHELLLLSLTWPCLLLLNTKSL